MMAHYLSFSISEKVLRKHDSKMTHYSNLSNLQIKMKLKKKKCAEKKMRNLYMQTPILSMGRSVIFGRKGQLPERICGLFQNGLLVYQLVFHKQFIIFMTRENYLTSQSAFIQIFKY